MKYTEQLAKVKAHKEFLALEGKPTVYVYVQDYRQASPIMEISTTCELYTMVVSYSQQFPFGKVIFHMAVPEIMNLKPIRSQIHVLFDKYRVHKSTFSGFDGEFAIAHVKYIMALSSVMYLKDAKVRSECWKRITNILGSSEIGCQAMCDDIPPEAIDEWRLVDILHNKYACRVIKQNEKPYGLVSAADIAKINDVSNIRATLTSYGDLVQSKMQSTTRGDKMMNFFTVTGLKKWLANNRRTTSINLSHDLGIQIHSSKYVAVETDALAAIKKVFVKSHIYDQYSVGPYMIDLYFPAYNLAIECDERYHESQQQQDKNREDFIKEHLRCKFIRFKPHGENFNILDVLAQIHDHIITVSVNE